MVCNAHKGSIKKKALQKNNPSSKIWILEIISRSFDKDNGETCFGVPVGVAVQGSTLWVIGDSQIKVTGPTNCVMTDQYSEDLL